MKSKTGVFLAGAIALSLGYLPGASSLAEGTGVGNGADGRRAAALAKLRSELQAPVALRQGRGGSVATDLSSIYDWCARITSTLKREKTRAMLQLNAGPFPEEQRLDVVKQILKDALDVASEEMNFNPGLGSPMTKRMVDRGVQYANGIEYAIEKAAQEGGRPISRRDLLTEINFMAGFIDLIVWAEENLNRPYYIPYVYQYGRVRERCPENFVLEFSKRYIEYVVAELRFVSGPLFVQKPLDPGIRFQWVALGTPQGFLKLAELSSGLLADEISETLEATQFACKVSDLKLLSQTLFEFNECGDHTYFPGLPYAVEAAALEMQRIAAEMSCRH